MVKENSFSNEFKESFTFDSNNINGIIESYSTAGCCVVVFYQKKKQKNGMGWNATE